jgi:ABC-2 type transport system permease protein
MPAHADQPLSHRVLRQTHAAWVIAKKDARIYYLKPPVLISGVIFPVFFYLAFAAGRNIPGHALVPGVVAMALFFTASAVGPLVTPWERHARTWERLVTSPASLWAIVVGDVAAGAAFGAILSLIPVGLGIWLAGASVADAGSLALGIGLGAVTFAALGVLMAAPATEGPSQVMMLSNLVRLPLIFVSGVFVPLAEMPAWGRWLAPCSPLSYAADLIRVGFGGPGHFPSWADALALPAFALAFLALARRVHRVAQEKAR